MFSTLMVQWLCWSVTWWCCGFVCNIYVLSLNPSKWKKIYKTGNPCNQCKQSTLDQTANGSAVTKEDNPRAVEAMIHFMYRFDYDRSSSDHSHVSLMLFNVNVYQVADKYGVPKLKEHVKEKFEKIIETCWEMDDFPLTITEAYSGTPKTDRGLQDPLIRTRHEIPARENRPNPTQPGLGRVGLA